MEWRPSSPLVWLASQLLTSSGSRMATNFSVEIAWGLKLKKMVYCAWSSMMYATQTPEVIPAKLRTSMVRITALLIWFMRRQSILNADTQTRMRINSRQEFHCLCPIARTSPRWTITVCSSLGGQQSLLAPNSQSLIKLRCWICLTVTGMWCTAILEDALARFVDCSLIMITSSEFVQKTVMESVSPARTAKLTGWSSSQSQIVYSHIWELELILDQQFQHSFPRITIWRSLLMMVINSHLSEYFLFKLLRFKFNDDFKISKLMLICLISLIFCLKMHIIYLFNFLLKLSI